MSAFALSDAANQSSQFRRIGLEILADLSEHTGATATLSGRIGHRRIYIGQVKSSQLVRISVQVGSAQPLTIGASGAVGRSEQRSLSQLHRFNLEILLNTE
ncbi:IclR family transcriptional regulator domain-containing protein [Microbacterium sp. A82]|uniref:IclR family transcriptional regulator domain-containing protein n=1 Tax=Microbacterium sp. A82 TaxID=3450452 RepID=UPI003F37EBA9